MEATKRRHNETEETPSLPDDLVLEVIARSDPATVVRCAATAKFHYRHVTDPAFLQCLRYADRVPLALFDSQHGHRKVAPRPWLFVPAQPSTSQFVLSCMSRNADLFDHYRPVASRSCLLVLRCDRRPDHHVELCVCNPMTGHRTFLPPKKVLDGESYVLLPGDDNSGDGGISQNSFQLLIVEKDLRTQTFSSKMGTWGTVTETPNRLPYRAVRVQPSPVVLRGVAHWLYHYCERWDYYVVALEVGTGQAESFEVPKCCHRRRMAVDGHKELLLASSADGKLCLVVAEALVISIWTLSEGSWAREVVVQKQRILESLKPSAHPMCSQSVEFEWFGERSGAVIMNMSSVGMFLLNLRTKEFRQLTWSSNIFEPFRFYPYEMDLVSLLPAPKSF